MPLNVPNVTALIMMSINVCMSKAYGLPVTLCERTAHAQKQVLLKHLNASYCGCNEISFEFCVPAASITNSAPGMYWLPMPAGTNLNPR